MRWNGCVSWLFLPTPPTLSAALKSHYQHTPGPVAQKSRTISFIRPIQDEIKTPQVLEPRACVILLFQWGKPLRAYSRTCHADCDVDSCGRLHPWGHHQYRTLSLPPGQSRGDHPRPHTSQRNKMRCVSSRVIPTFFKLSAVNRFARAIPSTS